jgi:phosphoglycolate phosphatase
LNRYRHVVWDWNGTLIDDAWLCTEILNGILRSRGLPVIDCNRYAAEFCFPVRDYYEKLGVDFSVEPFEVLATAFVEEYDRRRFECRLRPEAGDVLQAVEDRGIDQSILSAYEQHRLEEAVVHYQLGRFFVRLFGLTDHLVRSKVDNGRRMVDELAIDPAQVLLVGDTVHDFEVARALGAECVLVTGGHNCREKLQTCRVPVLGSMSEVLPLLAGP